MPEISAKNMARLMGMSERDRLTVCEVINDWLKETGIKGRLPK